MVMIGMYIVSGKLYILHQLLYSLNRFFLYCFAQAMQLIPCEADDDDDDGTPDNDSFNDRLHRYI